MPLTRAETADGTAGSMTKAMTMEFVAMNRPSKDEEDEVEDEGSGVHG